MLQESIGLKMNALPNTVLINIWAPNRTLVINLLLVVGCSLITALSAQLVIFLPFTPVPITGQTFAVLLSGGLLGSRLGMSSQLLYLFEGAIGLPFFAKASGGIAIFIGPTAGYLLGFPIAAFIVGYLVERGWNKSFFKTWAAMILAEMAIFGLGLLVLGKFIPITALLTSGLIPFIPGAVIKDFAAITILFGISKINRNK